MVTRSRLATLAPRKLIDGLVVVADHGNVAVEPSTSRRSIRIWTREVSWNSSTIRCLMAPDSPGRSATSRWRPCTLLGPGLQVGEVHGVLSRAAAAPGSDCRQRAKGGGERTAPEPARTSGSDQLVADAVEMAGGLCRHHVNPDPPARGRESTSPVGAEAWPSNSLSRSKLKLFPARPRPE